MEINKIKANAPNGANFYQDLNGNIYYFIDGFHMWNGKEWKRMFDKDMSHLFTAL